ncbi:efflux RND transporter periplasmic adaptor subunit [Arundinibacter roseus]|uniref:Efflux RND transporter periplasmic adaptor subunit n=1 Tax=Arundinibacter roseus TaxID=2070510 RepID=A0A4R4KL41_9BACT|nr:efflux RND transporter periplasmic adaptor subunit [Arundinibacter roseus]TDB68948.1 efflux RND transporter periplasmic adaptor subunit [Arundinibacter roseus]
MKTITNAPGYVAVICAFLLAGCTVNSKENADKNAPKITVDEFPVIELTAQKAELHREYVGDINAVRNVEIYARVKGYLEQIYVDEGQEVRKGQLLFRINDEEYEAEAAKAKANLQSAIAEAKAAELEVSRIKQLVDKKVISKIEWEVAEARLLASQARIEEARSAQTNAAIHMSRTRIKAPFDGVINRIPYKVGSLIDEGTLLTSVSDTRFVYVYFNVSENEYLEFIKSRKQTGDTDNRIVELQLADGSEFPEKGRIQTMEGEFDEGTGSIAFRAQFSNPGKLLKHRSSGTIRLTNAVTDAILVPQKAVFEIQDKSYVYVVGKDNQVKVKSFVPKSRFSDYYLVQSGLKEGDRVVYEGIQSLKDNVKILPKLVKADTGKSVSIDEGLSL